MPKKAVLLTSAFLCSAIAASNDCICKPYTLSTTEKVLYGTVAAGSLIAVPFVLPAGALASIAAAGTTLTAAAYLVPTTTVGKVCFGINIVQWIRPRVIQTTQEEAQKLKQERSLKPVKSKEEFISCLISNKTNSARNALGVPLSCEKEAFFYAAAVGMTEVRQRIQSFNAGDCFCK
jgi:hypothetical protein